VLEQAAGELGLGTEPGRNVVEIRASGMHKGLAVHDVAEQTKASGFVFVGDDLGDLEAFRAVEELRAGGMPTLLVCSASEEEAALAERADVVVDGPDGVMAFLAELASTIAQ
jgi:trehalose 6-phosphate phosphatase